MFSKKDIPSNVSDLTTSIVGARAPRPTITAPTAKTPALSASSVVVPPTPELSEVMKYLRPNEGEPHYGNREDGKPEWRPTMAVLYRQLKEKGLLGNLQYSPEELKIDGELSKIKGMPMEGLPDKQFKDTGPVKNLFLNALSTRYKNTDQGQNALLAAYAGMPEMTAEQIFTTDPPVWPMARQPKSHSAVTRGNIDSNPVARKLGKPSDAQLNIGTKILQQKRQGIPKEEAIQNVIREGLWDADEINEVGKRWHLLGQTEPGAEIGKYAYVKSREEEEEESNVVPAGLIGMGTLSAALGQYLNSNSTPGTYRALKDFDEWSPAKGFTPEILSRNTNDYVTKGHELSKMRLLGKSTGDVMKSVRTSPLAGLVTGAKWNEGSAHHYKEFGRDLQSAYMQRFGEMAGSAINPDANHFKRYKRVMSPEQYDKMLLPIGGEANIENAMNDPELREKLKTSVNDTFASVGYQSETVPHNVSALVKGQLNDYVEEVGGNVDLTKFDTWLKDKAPEIWSHKQRVDAEQGVGAVSATPGYKKFTKPLKYLMGYAKPVGIAAAAAGGGWLLHKYLQKKKEQAELEAAAGGAKLANMQQPEEEEEESNIPYWLLGTGAALGAAGGVVHRGISDTDAAKLKGFQDLKQNTYGTQGSELKRMLNDYIRKGHDATSIKPFGVPIEDAMRKIRQTPIAEGLGFGWKPGAGDHYKHFSESPYSAYVAHSREMFERAFDGSSTSPRRQKEMGKLQEFFGADKPYANYNDLLQQEFGLDRSGPVNKKEYLHSLGDAAQQFKNDAAATGGFDEWLKANNPELFTKKDRSDLVQALKIKAVDAIPNYNKLLVDPILAARKYLPIAGGVAAAAGGGWLLHRYMQKKKEQKEQELMASGAKLASIKLVNSDSRNNMTTMNKLADQQEPADAEEAGNPKLRGAAYGAAGGAAIGGLASLLTGDWKYTAMGGLVGAAGGYMSPEAIAKLESLFSVKEEDTPDLIDQGKDVAKRVGTKGKEVAKGVFNTAKANSGLAGAVGEGAALGAGGFGALKTYEGVRQFGAPLPGRSDALNSRLGYWGRGAQRAKPTLAKVKNLKSLIVQQARKYALPIAVGGGATYQGVTYKNPEEQQEAILKSMEKAQTGPTAYTPYASPIDAIDDAAIPEVAVTGRYANPIDAIDDAAIPEVAVTGR